MKPSALRLVASDGKRVTHMPRLVSCSPIETRMHRNGVMLRRLAQFERAGLEPPPTSLLAPTFEELRDERPLSLAQMEAIQRIAEGLFAAAKVSPKGKAKATLHSIDDVAQFLAAGIAKARHNLSTAAHLMQ